MKNSKLLSELVKIDGAITPAAIGGAGAVTSPYFDLIKWGKGLFIVGVAAMTNAATATFQVMQARNAAGVGAKVIANNVAIITSPVGVISATLVVDTVVPTNVVTINGLVFTAAAAADLPNRVFDQSAGDNATAASLAAAINHATAGVPGVTATANAATVTLVVDTPGEDTITIEDASATITPATLAAIAYVECDSSFLDDVGGFTHIALRVTNSAAIITGAVLLRGQGRFNPRQEVAAFKVNTAV